MFDLTTARQVSYGPGNELSVTVYQDRTEKNIWYMVPVPRLRIQNGQPSFSLTRYITPGGDVAGVCTFEVELHSPEDAKQAAQQQIPGIQEWGQFTWVSGNAFFDFELPGGGKFNKVELVRSPSLFGSNVAWFQIELPTDEAVKSFIAAFTEPGAVSPFRVAYGMGVLTQLLAAKASISYKASAAIEYERTYGTERDIWGNSKQVLTSVRQVLKQSGAGDVSVTPGQGATPEVIQLVRDWAWTTLEQQVTAAVESARALAGESGTTPVTATSDFTATYSEDAIVEWSTPVSAFLPKFDPQTWNKVYREVDTRELSVTFQLAGDFFDAEGKPLFEDALVTVKYPTRTTGNTFKLIPGDDKASAFQFVAPGTQPFDPAYEYEYTVNFPGGVPPYTSGPIAETATLVELRPNRFGVRNVTFVGSAVPFGKTVDRVFIDFFDNPPEGQETKLQTKELKANGPDAQVSFSSTYHVPITNTYDYRLRYVSGDQVITFQPPQQFGSNNADLVQVLSPATSLSNLVLRALVTKKGGGFLSIDATAAYFDNQNPPNGPSKSYSWTGWEPGSKKGLYSSETWFFDANPDVQTAFFRTNGQIIFGDGEIFEITDLPLAYSKKPLILMDTELVYAVSVYADQVDWETVSQVTLNVFQLQSSGEAAPLEIARAALRPSAHGDGRVTLPGVDNLVPYNILPPASGAKSLPLYYTLRRKRNAASLQFYFNADYQLADGTRQSIAQTEVTNKLQIHLPPLPPKTPGEPEMVQHLVLDIPSEK